MTRDVPYTTWIWLFHSEKIYSPQLILKSVSENDLADECNRECCICFFKHLVGDTGIARLPTRHIFVHKPCISEWLSKQCTSPLCRYEIRTDIEMYEIERIERMRARKIRARSLEIRKMSTTDLQHLTATSEVDHDILLPSTLNFAFVIISESGTARGGA